MIAFALFFGEDIKADHAYGLLVNHVLPAPLTGFFAAAMFGAILSSFNSALNSTTTLFSLGLYKAVIKKDATEAQVVRSGKVFGWVMAGAAMGVAPLLADVGSIFGYLQKMNGMYFIPIFAVVVVGMLSRRVPPIAAKIGLVSGFVIIAIGYFVSPFDVIVGSLHEFHFLGITFAYLVILMLVIGEIKPLEEEWDQVDVKAVDMTPWKHRRITSIALLIAVALIYMSFADTSVLLP
jgi:SSS family solute:Na+ symporter